MRILVVGGGPAGLSFARSLKQIRPDHSIVIVDQMEATDVAGWGITLSPEVFGQIGQLAVKGTYCNLSSFSVSLEGDEFLATPIDVYATSRQRIVDLLRTECVALGVTFRMGTRFQCLGDNDFREFDLVVGADGASSTLRSSFNDAFGTRIVISSVYHAWFSTPRAFAQRLRRILRGYRGALFCASAYQFDEALSTFIVECTPNGWDSAEFANMSDTEACELISRIFADDLGHNRVQVRDHVQWRRFAYVRNERWFYHKTVLIGDAAHTTHFSKGFGTVIAIRDSLSLASHLAACDDVESALNAYEQDRVPPLSKLQAQAEYGRQWYERLMTLFETDSIAAVRDVLVQTEKSRPDQPSMWTRP